MKKLAFHIAKGGTGKTSLSGNCAHLSSKTKKTILIDADPQGNTTSWFMQQPYEYEIADILKSDGQIPVAEGILQLSENFHLMPTRGLSGGLKNYGETQLIQEPLVFDDLNDELERMGFEVAIYDLSPGLSQLERCVILSVDEVIIPVLGEYFSIDGVETAIEEIQRINRKLKRNVKATKLVVNALNKSFRRHRETYRQFSQLDFELFAIAQDSKIAEAQFTHEPLAVYEPGSKAIPELTRLTNMLVGV